MDTYRNYQEFLADLSAWGLDTLELQENRRPKAPFSPLLEKSMESAGHGVFSPFLYLTLAAGLDQEETLLLAAALYAGLEGEALTFPAWECFWAGEPEFPGAELYFQPPPLLFVQEGAQTGAEAGLELTPRVFLFLQGALLEPRRLPGMEWYHQPGQPLPYLGAGIRLYPRIARCLKQIPGKKLVYLQGLMGCGRKLNYAYLAAQSHMGLAVLSLGELQSESHLRELQTECLLHHALLAVELPEDGGGLPALLGWLEREETIFLLGVQEELPQGNWRKRQYLPFSIQPQAALEDKELYHRLTLPYQWDCENTRKAFLNRYNFLPGRMHAILELAKSYSLSSEAGQISSSHLRKAILGVSSHSLDKYATKVRGVYQMEDLILPDAPKEKLLHIINRARNRKLVYEEWGFLEKSAYGNGISMIFAGPPGTGKTMAAQVMAAELGMELYRVELPAVVDKYIGETEKKLNRIFGEAEKGMAILFFDEADVLFSKRTEIKESNDKYSNMEIAFLLQKMEEYEGISILATNYLQNFDSAFRRRISDIIDFPLPDAALRQQMWHSMVPARLPISDEIDFGFLARQFELSGSMIKNALAYACFLAAETQHPLLNMEQLLKGVSHELEKSGKKLSRGEYGEYGHLF